MEATPEMHASIRLMLENAGESDEITSTKATVAKIKKNNVSQHKK